MMEQGKQMAAGFIDSGEMVIDAEPEKGFFRVKLRNIQPPGAVPQVTAGLCFFLENAASMLNLQVKKFIEQQGGIMDNPCLMFSNMMEKATAMMVCCMFTVAFEKELKAEREKVKAALGT